MKFYQAKDAQRIEPKGNSYDELTVSCCDCGLTHKIKIHRYKQQGSPWNLLKISFTREDKITKQMRKLPHEFQAISKLTEEISNLVDELKQEKNKPKLIIPTK